MGSVTHSGVEPKGISGVFITTPEQDEKRTAKISALLIKPQQIEVKIMLTQLAPRFT
jgi:hypothetical protein